MTIEHACGLRDDQTACSAGSVDADPEGSQRMFLIYEIELPKGKDPVAFAEFLKDEWIPAVRMGPTRVGQVHELTLLHEVANGSVEGDAEDTGTRQTFLLLVKWVGMSHPKAGAQAEDEAVERKFERFGATMKNQTAWEEVARRALGTE